MKYLTFCILALCSFTQVSGQVDYSDAQHEDPLYRLENKEFKGSVILTLDTLIQENYYKHLIKNKKDEGIEGYRIRIFSDNGHGAKEAQTKVKANFLSQYPDINTHNRYEGSYYKIYVGDFRTKREAMKMLETIKKNFPDAFIVEDKIIIEE